MRMRSLAKQIFVRFLIVILLSLSSVGLFSYWKASKALEKQSAKNIAQMISNASYQADLYLQTYERVSNSLVANSDIQAFLSIDPNDSYDYYYYTDQIQKYAFRPAFLLYPLVSLMYVIGDHGRAVSDDNQNQKYSPNFDPAAQLAYLNAHTPDNGAIAFLKRSVIPSQMDSTITLARRIRGTTSYVPSGVLAIEFPAQELERIWSQLDLTANDFFFIVDNQGQLIYEPSHVIEQGSVSQQVVQRVIQDSGGTFTANVGGQTRLFISRKSEYSGWHLTMSIPLKELREPISAIRSTTLLVGIGTLLVALLLATGFGRSIVKPIQALKNGMRQTEKGKWSHIEVPKRQDEIAGLMNSYNLMVTRLSEMINQVYEAELAKQKAALELQVEQLEHSKAEFQALQLQINPHFLYNTLETIKCYAVVEDSEEITEMVEAMAYMLRYSIQTNLEEITVVNELKHVLNYMTILKHRINRDFEIEVLIPPSLLLAKMVRLTLQPLVENSFQHAFPRGIEAHHAIRIDARREGEQFLVIVEDNGAGIAPDKLAELTDKLKMNRLIEISTKDVYHRGGIGVINVHRRIQMVFGEAYGVTVESKVGEGTRVIMTMPADWTLKRI